MMRPFVFGLSMASLRNNAMTLLHDLWDSSVTLAMIFLFVTTYAATGHFLFRYTQEGAIYFPNLGESIWTMQVLLTTANFPDVMLPAYSTNFFWCIFFILFLIMGLYLLLNFLLAQIFYRFRLRLANQSLQLLRDCEDLLFEFITQFDCANKGFLTQEEGTNFMCALLNKDEQLTNYLYNRMAQEMSVKDMRVFYVSKLTEFFLQRDGYIKTRDYLREY